MNKKYERYINYIVNDIEPPYFKNMWDQYGLSEKEYKLILSKIFNQPVIVKGNFLYNQNNDEIYYENSDNGYWYKQEYDSNGNRIYFEDGTGDWLKYEYDQNGNEIYYENKGGYWYKKEYDFNGNIKYYETIGGFWIKHEYDQNGNMVYYENSNGRIIDKR